MQGKTDWKEIHTALNAGLGRDELMDFAEAVMGASFSATQRNRITKAQALDAMNATCWQLPSP